jgi:ATP-binding cassette subfamily F protein uup
MPLVTLETVSMAFGHLPLLDQASLQIDPGERLAVIGRNGSGKSTLLSIVAGDLEPDAGTVWRQPAVRVARLTQDVPLDSDRTVFDVVADGLGALRALVTDYHQAARAVAARPDDAALERLGRLQHDLEERDGWRLEQRVELVLARLSLPAEAVVSTLSGGWRRRVLLAQALVTTPDLLLLDEPTNHLDIDAIEWLEQFVADYAGAVMFVTHDRAFLERLATRVVELDRGRLTSWPGDYATFVRKKEEWLAAEALADAKFDRRLAGEEAWLRRGIKARRTRDEGRVRALLAMRAERQARRQRVGTVDLQVAEADPTGRMVFELDEVTRGYDGRAVVRGFSTRIMRGDRVGLIGRNGSGKTTLLRLMTGDLAPDSGTVRVGANVQVAYYDQQREQLDPERTVADTVGDGNDTITVNGRSRHVHGYLEDFLFPPERARAPVRALSGGERNRLLLARLFTRPVNVLVLDEPTNDLDLETLALLEAMLVEWPGTLLLVSHDRRFLDHIVTSTIALDGEGNAVEYVGGWVDYERQRPRAVEPPSAPEPGPRTSAPSVPPPPTARRKLSYMEQRELDALPARIEVLESERTALQATITGPDFYKEAANTIRSQLARLDALDAELEAAYTRWDALESRTT